MLLELKNGEPYGGLVDARWRCWRRSPACCEGWNPGSRAIWRSGLLAEMRIAVFRKLDALAPAYLTAPAHRRPDGAGDP